MAYNRHPSGDNRLMQWAPFDEPTSVIGWFDRQISRLQDDLFRHSFFDMPQANHMVLDPQRRSRLFDAMFSPQDEVLPLTPTFHTNRQKNQLECHVSTGCGDFFRPEDVEINVTGRNVEFKARREHKSADGHNYAVREVRRVMTIPENADIEKLHAELSPNGKLMITAPLVTPPEALEPPKPEGPIPIKINRH